MSEGNLEQLESLPQAVVRELTLYAPVRSAPPLLPCKPLPCRSTCDHAHDCSAEGGLRSWADVSRLVHRFPFLELIDLRHLAVRPTRPAAPRQPPCPATDCHYHTR